MKYCTHCNTPQSNDAKFCNACGAEISQLSPLAIAQDLEQKIRELSSELQSVEDALEMQSYGFYAPKFGLDDSEQYVEKLEALRIEQKKIVSGKKATICPKAWIVEGSASKGRKMMEEHSRLMLRAFLGDCDSAIASTKYGDVGKIEKRIHKCFADINKLSKTKGISISEEFLQMKVDELHLVHEHREILYREREEQKEIRQRMREEQRAEKELERIVKEASKEEEKQQKALEQAKGKLESAQGKELEKLEQLVTKLESELQEAIDRKAKSIARAQLTRSGHVYVLSNVGSFGEGVYKIGMTRRFDPLERVAELASASVPFPFDVHAMIYTEDAPKLENCLHREFEEYRVNHVNARKEYFRVDLEKIIAAVAKYHGEITFRKSSPAEEFRKSCGRPAEQEAVRKAG